MMLSKEKIAQWLEKIIADDYFRFDNISSTVEVINFKQDGCNLTIDYQFWNDGHALSDKQEYFIFDLQVANEYGCNFPAQMLLVKLRVKYSWKTAEGCLILDENYLEEVNDIDITAYNWGDPEIEKFINDYFNLESSEIGYAKEMLLDKYDAANKGVPDFIPQRLHSFFGKVITSKS